MWKLRKDSSKQSGTYNVVKAIILVGVAVLMILSTMPAKVTILDEGVKIHGLYGEVCRWETIKSVKLLDQLPIIERRTNGSALGSKLKGHFRTKEMGPVKLFADSRKPPFICIETDSGIAIFNLKDLDETMKVFEEITERTGKTG